MKFHCCACLRFHSRVVCMHRNIIKNQFKCLRIYTSGRSCSSIRRADVDAMRCIICFLPSTTSLLDFSSVAQLLGPVRVGGDWIETRCVPMLASVRGHFECAVWSSGKGEAGVAGRAWGAEKTGVVIEIEIEEGNGTCRWASIEMCGVPFGATLATSETVHVTIYSFALFSYTSIAAAVLLFPNFTSTTLSLWPIYFVSRGKRVSGHKLAPESYQKR